MADKTKGKTLQSGSTSTSADIAAFVNKVGTMTQEKGSAKGNGRLVFALDATMSRQPTWDLACSLQSEMFNTLAEVGGLNVQLLYFRGFGECRASKWVSNAAALGKIMAGIDCRGGRTQISKVLSHARKEHTATKVNALVYVGDAMEEDVDRLAQKAGELGLLGCPVFFFQEGYDPTAEQSFREMARLTKGAYARFDTSAPQQLADLLKAVARYASGGYEALLTEKSGAAKTLLEQLGR